MLDWIGILNGTIGSVVGGVILLIFIALVARLSGIPLTVRYLVDTCERKLLGRPFVWWECIGSRRWNLATGKMYEDTDGIPRELDKRILRLGNAMIANGQLPVFDTKTQDDKYIYWVVCMAPYGRSPLLAFYRRPRLMRWSNRR